MKFCLCNEVMAGWSWEKTCEFARKTGFDGLEVAPFTFAEDVNEISQSRRGEIRRVAADNGLALPAMHMLMFSPKGLHLNSPDPALRRRSADYLKAVVQLAGDLGCKIMVYGSPPTRNFHPAMTYRQGRALYKEGIVQCLDLARQLGVTLCIEPLAPAGTHLFNSVEAAFGFVLEVNHPNFGLMVDCKAMSSEAWPPADTIRFFGPEIRHIHVQDALGVPAGFGTLDFKPILHAIRQINYDGWLSLEPFEHRPDAESNVPVSLRYLKSIVAELGKGGAAGSKE